MTTLIDPFRLRLSRRLARHSFQLFVFLVIAVLLLPCSAFAGDVGEWKSLGPLGARGSVLAIAIDRNSGATYVAGQSGVSKSVDGGATWVDASNGLTTRWVETLVLDPRSPFVLYAGTFGGGVFKTIDAGSSWIPLPGSPAHARALAIVPLTPSTLYAGSNGEGVFKTTDGGVTWAHVDGLTVRTVSTIAIDPRASGTVYVGGQQDFASPKGLAKTTDGGATWKLVDLGPASSSIVSVVVDPSSPSTVYVAQLADSRYASTPTVMVSMDGGESWFSLVNSLPRFLAPTALAVDPGPSRKVYLGAYRTIYQSANGGGTWTEVTSGLTPVDEGGSSSVYAIAIDPRSSTIYAGTGGNGLFLTGDGGATWTRPSHVFSNLNITALAADPLAPLTIYAGTSPLGDPSGGGIFRTRDGGSSWTELDTKVSNASFRTLRIDPRNPSVIYATTSVAAGVLKSTNGGESWTPANTGLPPIGVGSFALDPTSPSTAYVSTDAGVYRSLDGAATWSATALNSGIVLAVAPTSPPTIYAGGLGLARSVDGGSTWAPVNTGLTGLIVSIAVDPSIPTTVYAGARGFPCFGPLPCRVTINGIARSTDGGGSWRLVNEGLARTDVSEIVVDPRTPGRVFAAVGGSVYGSTNGGGRWQPVTDRSLSDLGGRSASALAVDFSEPSNLYAGTVGASVFKRSASIAAVPCAPDSKTLCLNAGRFEVQASWSSGGGAGSGQAIPLTSDTGAFWFFTANNVELVTKVVDGRSFNGRFWVFVGALSDVEYSIRITDMLTGDVKTYFHPQGALASIGDTAAF